MNRVKLINTETNTVEKIVETDRPEFTAQQLLRNRDPRIFSVEIA